MLKQLSVAILLLVSVLSASAAILQSGGTYENSLVLTPLHVDYTNKTAEQFASDVTELKQRIGSAPHVLLGFAAFLDGEYPGIPLDAPMTAADIGGTLDKADLIVNRARANGIVTHISIVSGFFHGTNGLRRRAILEDVRNAQWFSDGLIAPATDLTDPNHVPDTAWITPSRNAQPFHARVEEGTRLIGQHLAALMVQNPDTLVSISGDGEAEFTYVRNYSAGGEKLAGANGVVYADYSPFMVEEFRDWIRAGRYDGDSTPGSDDDHNGHTFNGDFGKSFTSWRLQYYDNSGPIRYADYLRLVEKLPASGPYAFPGGFDAPRLENSNDPYWKEWILFRKVVISNWERDFAGWITTSADPSTGFHIPASRYYTHQIPADLIFGKSDDLRLKTSASYIETAVIEPLGGTGVTAFNGYDGKKHVKTATPELYSKLYMTSDNWGIMEYNPSMPYSNKVAPSSDQRYYMNELRMLYNFRPHVLVPFAWTDLPEHKRFSIKDSPFERALKQFVHEIGNTPWFSWRAALRE